MYSWFSRQGGILAGLNGVETGSCGNIILSTAILSAELTPLFNSPTDSRSICLATAGTFYKAAHSTCYKANRLKRFVDS